MVLPVLTVFGKSSQLVSQKAALETKSFSISLELNAFFRNALYLIHHAVLAALWHTTRNRRECQLAAKLVRIDRKMSFQGCAGAPIFFDLPPQKRSERQEFECELKTIELGVFFLGVVEFVPCACVLRYNVNFEWSVMTLINVTLFLCCGSCCTWCVSFGFFGGICPAPMYRLLSKFFCVISDHKLQMHMLYYEVTCPWYTFHLYCLPMYRNLELYPKMQESIDLDCVEKSIPSDLINVLF